VREEELKRELARITDDDGGGGLFLLYQPILDLKSDKICGFEALARLNSEKFGLVPPLEFIPIAEKTKLIVPIGWKIIDRGPEIFAQAADLWRDSVTVSINVSVIQLCRRILPTSCLKKVTECTG
jgi:EAL domain-containing protein (putative c-di-GMP-specific phosphodiesterase class I)